MPKIVAGVDSSTQSVKVVLREADSGELIASTSRPHPDGTEVDPHEWKRALDSALDEVSKYKIDAISIGGQQHGRPVDEGIADGQVEAVGDAAADAGLGITGDVRPLAAGAGEEERVLVHAEAQRVSLAFQGHPVRITRPKRHLRRRVDQIASRWECRAQVLDLQWSGVIHAHGPLCNVV